MIYSRRVHFRPLKTMPMPERGLPPGERAEFERELATSQSSYVERRCDHCNSVIPANGTGCTNHQCFIERAASERAARARAHDLIASLTPSQQDYLHSYTTRPGELIAIDPDIAGLAAQIPDMITVALEEEDEFERARR